MTQSEQIGADLAPADRRLIDGLLEPGETLARAAPALASMQRAGVVALGYAVPVFAAAWFPLHKAWQHLATASLPADGRVPMMLFSGIGLIFAAIGLRLLVEPWRLHRLYPHIVHALTDRRFLEIDRRSGPRHVFTLDDIWQMKTFSPFDRLTLWRRRFDTGTGARAKFRDFDGVRDAAAVAQAIAERTGVPVGLGRAAVAASVAQMSAEARDRLR